MIQNSFELRFLTKTKLLAISDTSFPSGLGQPGLGVGDPKLGQWPPLGQPLGRDNPMGWAKKAPMAWGERKWG